MAYLVERWAARFVSELFQQFDVAFVGYSVNDPVMRYLVDAVAVERHLVTNPKFFAQPWTARAPMVRTNARMFEYACHEGNYGLEFILRGAREEEKERQPQE